MWPNMQFSSDLVTFAKESLMENLFVSQRVRLHFVTLTAQGPWRIFFVQSERVLQCSYSCEVCG